MALGCGAMAAELADATGAFEGSLPGCSVDWMEVVVRHEDPVWKTGYWCSDARWVFQCITHGLYTISKGNANEHTETETPRRAADGA